MDKKVNYKAWNIDPIEISNIITDKDFYKYFIKYAILSPSSHNTQPWQFIINEDGVTIKPNILRALNSSDKNNKQLYISLGSLTAFYIITATYFGYKANYRITENNDIDIYCQKNISNDLDKKSVLFDYILKRVTNRNKYSMVFENKILESFLNYKIEGVNTIFIKNGEEKKLLSEIVINSGIEAMEDSNFREELSLYVKSNITNSFIGMPAFGMGIPLLPSLFAKHLLKIINMNKISRNNDMNILLNYTPVFCILETIDNSIQDWVRVGYQYALYTLYATSLGMVTHPYAAPIQIGENYKKIKKIIGSDNTPQFFFRMGVPLNKTKHSPRLLSKDVIFKF